MASKENVKCKGKLSAFKSRCEKVKRVQQANTVQKLE